MNGRYFDMNGRGAGLQKKIIIVKLYIHRKCILRWRNNNTLLEEVDEFGFK